MVTILPSPTSTGTYLGQNLAQGLSSGMQTGIQRGVLQDAFNKLSSQPGGNFLQQIAQIAPALLTTPGGAQALENIAPILSTAAQNAAIAKSIEARRLQQQQEQAQKTQSQQAQEAQMALQGIQPSMQPRKPEEQFRRPKAPSSATTPFPQITAGPQPQPEMSPQQIENQALSLMETSLNTGKPIDYGAAFKIANQQNENIRLSNAQIQQEKQLREAAQGKITENIVSRAANQGLIKTPEDQTVAEKLALQAANAPDDATRWEYVRTKMREYDSAKSAVQRELGLAGPFTNAYRKLNGDYKDEQEIIRSLQGPLDTFRQLGLYDEAKNMLVNDLGFGNEQAHLAVFPFTKQEKAGLSSFPRNVVKPSISANLKFPDSGFAMDEMQFNKFKDGLSDFLQQHPDIDLVSLRGNLNQDKKYDWHDIYRAIDELKDERRFDPDIEQTKQLNTIRSAPTPGLGAYFQYLWSGKR